MTEEIAAIVESLKLVAINSTGELRKHLMFAADFIAANADAADDFLEKEEEIEYILSVFGL